MKYEDLRNIRRSEYETNKLITIAPDTFEKVHAELALITKKVYELNDPFSEDAHDLIEQTNVMKETLLEIYLVRLNKILDLAFRHAEGNYYDREEIKRMIPVEKEMFEKIITNIENCQRALIHNAPQNAKLSQKPIDRFSDIDMVSPVDIGDEESEPYLSNEVTAKQELPHVAAQKPAGPITHPCVLVHVLEDMDSFMGVDGRIYTLAKGDIVTLPERNAAVLSERNIVLNINLCK